MGLFLKLIIQLQLLNSSLPIIAGFNFKKTNSNIHYLEVPESNFDNALALPNFLVHTISFKQNSVSNSLISNENSFFEKLQLLVSLQLSDTLTSSTAWLFQHESQPLVSFAAAFTFPCFVSSIYLHHSCTWADSFAVPRSFFLLYLLSSLLPCPCFILHLY